MPPAPPERVSRYAVGWRAIAMHAACAAACLAVALWFTWPLALHLDTHVPGDGAGDNLTFVWTFWWMREALASPVLSFFQTNALFYPVGTPLVLNTHTALNALAGATVLGPLSIVAAQNVVLIVSIACNGFAAYLLAWDATRHRLAAMTAAVCFACAPYFAAHARGHFNLTSAWALPLFALCWRRALRRQSWLAAAGAGATAVAAAYTDYYYLLFLAIFTVCSLAVRWLHVSARGWRQRPSRVAHAALVACALCLVAALAIAITGGGAFHLGAIRVSATSSRNPAAAAWLCLLAWAAIRTMSALRVTHSPAALVRRDAAGLGLVLAILAVGTFPIAEQVWTLWRHGDYASQTYFWRSSPEGIDLATLALGNPFHAWWGDAVRHADLAFGIDAIESTAWLGLVPVLLLAVTWRAWRARPHAAFWLAIGGVFFTWALGPDIHVFGAHTGLYLPIALIRFVPIASNARMPGRAMVMVYLAVAMLVAIALAAQPRRRVAWLLAALVFIEVLPIELPLLALDRPPVYSALARMPPGALLEIPFGVRDGFGELGRFDSRVLYYQTIHAKPLVGGFVARLSPNLAARYHESPALGVLLTLSAGGTLAHTARDAARDEVTKFLQDTGVRYVVINTRTTPAALNDFVLSLPLTLAETDATHRLYRVTTVESAF